MTITLDPADYWKLRALSTDVAQAKASAEALMNRAIGKQHEFMVQLGAKYTFDIHMGAGSLNDDALTLTVEETPAAGA